jgi:uncharacterized protein YutE (UPF0331/DUF86 family)
MTSSEVNLHVISQRASWIREMLIALRDLPIHDKSMFLANKHNVAAAESYLRRSLEAIFDIGRHILAKRFGTPAIEYKEIAKGLLEKKILQKKEADILRNMAGYRNRMVHFYHEISPEELHQICTHNLGEIEMLLEVLTDWLKKSTKKEN